MNEISSAHNAKYKRWLSLLDSRGIKKEGVALLSGEKLVREFLAVRPEGVEEILLPPKHREEFELRQTRLSSPLFKALDVLGTHNPLAVVRAPRPPEWKAESPRGLELILALGDPSNLGALLRSAEAFGVRRVILTKECASPYLPRALKAASGSTFRLNLTMTGALADLDIKSGVGLEMRGEDLTSFAWPKNAYLVLGEEGLGLPAQLQLQRIKIPMHGPTESLNATVAASIALFHHASLQRSEGF